MISVQFEKRTNILRNVLVKLGKDSFYIYLLHMLIQSIPVNYLSGAGGIILRPFLLVALTEIMIIVFRNIWMYMGRCLKCIIYH